MPLHRLQTEWDAGLRGGDPLGFPGYGGAPDRESVLTGRTEHYALIESRFEVLGGSMGAVHGERVVRAYRRAADEGLPVVVLTQSGGARMQEGMVSLIQMPRCAAAARAHGAAGLLSVGVYRSPTTGGVFASYGSLVDVRAAVAGATVGFAGPRVVELTLGRRLPADSHTAESAYAAGLADALLDDDEQAGWVEAALGLRATPLSPRFEPAPGAVEPSSAWDEVGRSRAPGRPSGFDWAALLTDSWIDLHGTDPTVRAGLARLDGDRVVVVALDRYAADGRPTPAGFRLAQRAGALAGRLGLPLLSLIDTPGAAPGAESEADGIAGEIARTMVAFDACPTTTVAVCVGEGGSGGALAVGHADRLLVLEHGIFSVIAPEGAAAILERDATKAPTVAEHLRLASRDLLDLGIVDEVVPETVDQVRAAVRRAVGEARPGDRHRRLDAATQRWVQ
ncbi:MAG TPA: carboxyl transferase domain-containing protein [Acidimicrobiales bacterium]|nr:carboxyl transferase domain-containing protein [Acidimicrobiales bacterium]